jgi:transposase-like protein
VADPVGVLNPKIAIAGHKKTGAPDTPAIIEASKRYLNDFSRLKEATSSDHELYDAMTELPPNSPAKVVVGATVISGVDASPVFEASEHVFDLVALSIEDGVIGDRGPAVFSAEEKTRVVLEGLRGEESIAELCRRGGIASSMYYGGQKISWRPAKTAARGRHSARRAAARSICPPRSRPPRATSSDRLHLRAGIVTSSE